MAVQVTLVASTCLFVNFFALVTVLRSLRRRSSNKKSSQNRSELGKLQYEDGDGVATRESMSSFGNGVPRFFIATGAVSGLAMSIFCAVHGIFDGHEMVGGGNLFSLRWISVAGWCSISVQIILMIRERCTVRRFEIGAYVAISSISISASLVFAFLWLRTYVNIPKQEFNLFVGQFVISMKTFWACGTLQRRPEVYHEGRIVDSQYTSSFFQRYTFSWIAPLLERAQIVDSLQMSDLPEMHNGARAKTLRNSFEVTKRKHGVGKHRLWRIICQNHKSAFVREWSLAVVEPFALMFPQICLYQILTILERGSHSAEGKKTLWLWILALGVSKLIHLLLETWLEWIKFGLLATPVRSQLTAIIFEKSLRMKNVKNAGQGQTKAKSFEYSARAEEDNGKASFSEYKDGDEENISLLEIGDHLEGSQTDEVITSHVNLVGVDVQRVSMFCGENSLLLGSLVKMILGVWFLVYLIGWISTFAGLAMPLLMQPISIFVSRNYGKAQVAVMSARDEKTHIITEVLHGIRQIKFSALEDKWQALIMQSRDKELKAQTRVYSWMIFLLMTWLSMPVLLGAVGLSLYVWISKSMLASVAFTALSVFSTLEFTMGAIPINIAKFLDARISCNRIQQHLELIDKASSTSSGEHIAFKDAKLLWPRYGKKSKDFSLGPMNLNFPLKALSLVHGKTGVGKSLILAGIIGEADVVEGYIDSSQPPASNDPTCHPIRAENWMISTSIAYVAQIPWIENGTVQSNILFGLPLDSARYESVIHASALSPDLEIMPHGDQTEVGAVGVTLSGGQRQRLTFARALYSRAGILVLDDIFSAVDVHVGRHMLEHGIKAALSNGRTVIIATHHIDVVLPLASYVVECEDYTAWGTTRQPEDNVLENIEHTSGLSEDQQTVLEDDDSFVDMPLEELSISRESRLPQASSEIERLEQGRVKWKVYNSYVQVSGGWTFWFFALFVFVFSTLLLFGRSYWIKIWSEASEPLPGAGITNTQSAYNHKSTQNSRATEHLVFYLLVYLGGSLISIVFIGLKIAVLLYGSLRASKTLFETFTARIIRTQLRWLDTVPTGRILNRFSSDFALIDSQLGMDFVLFLNRLLAMATIAAAALLLSSMMIFPVLLFGLACIYYTSMYLPAARAIRRLESINRSPVFDFFDSAMSGLSTIRSFGKADEYQILMEERIDKHTSSSWYIILANRWVAARQGFLGVLFALCLAASIVILPDISVALAGFALSFGVEFSRLIIITIAQYAAFELDMNSTERVMEYITQAPLEKTSGDPAPPNWPTRGFIEFRNYETGYGSRLPSVLKGLNFKFESHQRIGVVGRTGSGKSTLTLALFRFLEARQGSILIDGVDTSQLLIRDLRQNLSIIPQDPVLFSGTLRTNLDPFNKYSDQALRVAMQRLHLGNSETTHTTDGLDSMLEMSTVNLFADFDYTISRGGFNLSSGQRQLVCLVRAFLQRPKVLILDEATSAVDLATENLIQRSIRENFKDCTLIVVAHRLSTLADFDKILVLEHGSVVEFDTPQVLLRTKGQYWGMVNEGKAT